MTKEGTPTGPELDVNPQNWGGHSFADECDWIDNTSIKTVKQFQKLNKLVKKDQKQYESSNKEAEKITRPTIEEFLKLGGQDGVALATFREGQTVELASYNPGAILRTTEEMIWTEINGLRAGDLIRYLVLYRSELNDGLYAAKYHFAPIGAVYGGYSNTDIEVGIVDHHRIKPEPGIF